MGQLRARLRELRDGKPVALAGSIEVVALVAVAGVAVAADLDADTVALLVLAAGALAAGVTRFQHNNAIPYPKVRRTADDEQADRDEFVDPAEPV